MSKKVVVIRQGDINLLPVDSIPEGGVLSEPVGGDKTVLGYGEVTGHAHVMPFTKAKQYRVGEQEFVHVLENTTLRHGDLHTGSNPDHHTINIPKGMYEKRIAQEATPTGIRKVVD